MKCDKDADCDFAGVDTSTLVATSLVFVSVVEDDGKEEAVVKIF
jgi:hypothetical protein